MKENHDKLAAPCGLYCGVCGLYRAYKTNNQKLKEKLGGVYGIDPSAIVCEGCLSDIVFGFCKSCQVRNCALEKKLSGCHECGEFPCTRVEEFPFPEARDFMLSGTKKRRELGTEKWAAWQMAHFTCKECGGMAFRGARRCPECKAELRLEG